MGRFGGVLGSWGVVLLLGCEAGRPAPGEVCVATISRPQSPILRRLLAGAADEDRGGPLADDRLSAQLLALQCMPADEQATLATRLSALRKFLRQLSETPELTAEDATAVERFFEEMLDEPDAAMGPHYESLLRGFRHALSRHGLPGLQVRAAVRLSAWLWQRSCPIAGSDGACLERRDVWPACLVAQRELKERTQRRYPLARVELIDPCTSGPQYGYRVVRRYAGLASEAQHLAQAALALAERRALKPEHPDDALAEALAHAEFLRLEPEFERQLSQPQWPGSPGRLDPLQPILYSPIARRTRERVYARLQRWLRRRFVVEELQGSHIERSYERVLAYPQTRWGAAGQARIGQLLIDLGTQLQGCARVSVLKPPPGFWTPGEWSRLFRDAYVHCGDDPLESLSGAAANHLIGCELWLEQAGGRRDAVTDFCREVLPQLRPSEWPADHEVVPKLAEALPLDVAPPYSAR